MKIKLFMFSNRLLHRILRHIFFWLVWFVFLFANWSGLWHADNIEEFIQYDLLSSVNRILPQMVFCYFNIYYLLPKFFMRKRFVLGTFLLGISFLTFYCLQYLALILIDPFEIMELESNVKVIHRPSEYKIFPLGAFLYHSGPIVCCAVIASIKFLKFWYLKQQENVVLKRENAIAEFQLLKAQVHPHFLFNTLNNIYSFSLSKSPLAGELIEKLSDMLHYMILEGQNTLVPLRKEIKLIQDYISLQRVRYGDRLDISMDICSNTENKFIAPLLMIPFIENSFKHGSSKMLMNPMFELSIMVERDQLIFKLKNNKPDANSQDDQLTTKGGIGLTNTAKRLQLLYPNKHDLKIESTDTTFFIQLNIVLNEMKEVNIETHAVEATQKTLSYADS